jgi:subtilisin family serine protease
VVSASYGEFGGASTVQRNAIQALGNAGILFVVAAGNGACCEGLGDRRQLCTRSAAILHRHACFSLSPRLLLPPADNNNTDVNATYPANYGLSNQLAGAPPGQACAACTLPPARARPARCRLQHPCTALQRPCLFLCPDHPALLCPNHPAAAVGASIWNDNRASFSNYGASTIHVAAPGVVILSAGHQADDEYVQMSGTRMACPVVSGIAALLFSAKPTATVAEVRWGRGEGGREAELAQPLLPACSAACAAIAPAALTPA